ncbi:hypothetical protein HDU76_012919 [Blyttiomyces sp. JEL0837]|nr:hypothetical protein HDU76_012919 [Blyttiomyces sp. JEL0837]
MANNTTTMSTNIPHNHISSKTSSSTTSTSQQKSLITTILILCTLLISQVSAGPTAHPQSSFIVTNAHVMGTWKVPCSSNSDNYSVHVGKVDDSSGEIVVSMAYQGKKFFKSIPNTPLISTTFGTDQFGPGDGIFEPTLSDTDICNQATLATVTIPTNTNRLQFFGDLIGTSSKCQNLNWWMEFYIGDSLPGSNEKRELKMDVKVGRVTVDGSVKEIPERVVMSIESDADEEYYGFGEQFSFLNAKGRSIPIITQEGGIGRGLQPITFLLNRFEKGTGGTPVSTYSAVPQYISSKNYLLHLPNFTAFTNFDLTNPTKTIIRSNSNTVTYSIMKHESYLDLIELYSGIYCGRQPMVPEWTGEGVVLGLEGGSEKVFPVLRKVVEAGVPVVASWMQDWAGVREQKILGYTQSRVWFNWESDDALFYINSFLADVSSKQTPSKNNYYKIAESSGYLIKNNQNKTYVLNSGPGFSIGLMDLSNPNAVKWFQDIVRKEVFEIGVSGYMADFGEYLPMDSVLASGVDPNVYHNQFPDDWASLNEPFLTEYPTSLIFQRSWNSKSPGKIQMLWHGDQLPSYDSNDGLQSAIYAALSSGFSGMPISHTDIGGFTIVKAYGIPIYSRTEELLSRWMEWAAFTPLFRTHPGSIKEDLQVYDTPNLLRQLKFTSGLFKSLQPYRRKLIKDANERGLPYLRPMVMMFPDDSEGWNDIKPYQQFMVGDGLLVTVVVDCGVTHVKVRFPCGKEGGVKWREVWTGRVFRGGDEVVVDAKVGRPAMFLPVERVDGGLLDGMLEFVKGYM